MRSLLEPEEIERVDPSEAPEGFTAVPKSTFSGGDNICNHCDWRKQCNDEGTDLLAFGHRCMGYPVLALHDGKVYQRRDKCSVVFLRIDGPDATIG